MTIESLTILTPAHRLFSNAHHIRELERAHEQDNQKWAKRMQKFLVTINKEVNKTKNNVLSKEKIEKYRKNIDPFCLREKRSVQKM